MTHTCIRWTLFIGFAAFFIERRASGHAWLATTAVLLLLAGTGALPIFGIAHGHIRWLNAYGLYASHALR